LRKNTAGIFFDPNREGAMKSTLLASVSIAALFVASGASAADLAVKARPMVSAAPVYSWTGCYVGAQVGWGWGRNNHTQTGSFSSALPQSRSGRVDTSGGLFGGQVGCNYQFSSNWVAGIQVDGAGTDFNGKANDPLDIFDSISLKTDWLASVTGRVGYTIYNNQGMLYVKGGGAWVHNTWDLTIADRSYGPAIVTETKTGWTVGAGMEWKFTQDWSGFAEYNYYSFGGSNLIGTAPGDTHTFTSNSQTISTVKIGVNYNFTQGPVVARY
jgi:outer membrane immunogenic protein